MQRINAAEAAGDVAVIVAQMQMHAGSTAVQQRACEALTALTEPPSGNLVKAGNAGAVEAVTAAVKAHATDAGVLAAACHVLVNLTFGRSLKTNRARAESAPPFEKIIFFKTGLDRTLRKNAFPTPSAPGACASEHGRGRSARRARTDRERPRPRRDLSCKTGMTRHQRGFGDGLGTRRGWVQGQVFCRHGALSICALRAQRSDSARRRAPARRPRYLDEGRSPSFKGAAVWEMGSGHVTDGSRDGLDGRHCRRAFGPSIVCSGARAG